MILKVHLKNATFLHDLMDLGSFLFNLLTLSSLNQGAPEFYFLVLRDTALVFFILQHAFMNCRVHEKGLIILFQNGWKFCCRPKRQAHTNFAAGGSSWDLAFVFKAV